MNLSLRFGRCLGSGPMLGLLAGMTFLGAALAARAQEAPPLGSFALRLGAGIGFAPAYPGAEAIMATLLPIIDARWRTGLSVFDTVYLSSEEGLGAVVLRSGPFSIAGGVGLARGRDEDASARLRGLGDIDTAARGYVTFRTDLGPVDLSLRVDRYFGEQEGTTLTFGATYRQPITSALTLIGRVGAVWADGEQQRLWFGVDDLQARRSGLPTYRPGSGFRNVSASLTGRYAISASWDISATIGVTHLLGDAADSPITQRETQPFGMLGVSYRF
jgi:outer membrane protein